MNIKTRTSLISIAISSILTLFKFILYFLSGSVAILSEAWHSFSDIGTSFLVFLAVKERKPSKEASQEPKSSPSRVHPEHKVSLTIGFFLLFVSIMLLLRIIAVKMVIIYKPLFCGILFIIFSIGSYFLYRFKTTVGESEKSAALISDGLHSKADMISALLTGFSLIIYRFGGNLDRFVGGIIALFIFSFAIETLVNVTSAHIKRDEEYVIKYKSYQIFEHVFKKDTFSRLIQLIESKLNWPLTKTKPYYLLPKLVKPGLIGLVILGLLGYLSTMLVIVGADEEAIIERFGRPLNKEKALQSGLHLKVPWPIDKVFKLKTREIKQINLGNVTDPGNLALLWTRPHGEEMHFLGGDNNFFNPYIVVHYRVNNIFDYLYQQKEPKELLDNIGYHVLTNVFVKKSFDEITISYRRQLELDIKEMLQKEIDSQRGGLEIVNVNIKDIHPPRQIANSFEEVIAAYQEKERLINEALSYRNKELPKARGEVAKRIASAQAYVIDKIRKAEGDNQRFLLKLEAFEESKFILTKKQYLEAMGESLKNSKKVIVDPETGLPDIWLNFDDLAPNWAN